MEYNTSTVRGGKVGTQVQQKLITKAAAKQTYLLTTKNLLRPYSNRIIVACLMFIACAARGVILNCELWA